MVKYSKIVEKSRYNEMFQQYDFGVKNDFKNKKVYFYDDLKVMQFFNMWKMFKILFFSRNQFLTWNLIPMVLGPNLKTTKINKNSSKIKSQIPVRKVRASIWFQFIITSDGTTPPNSWRRLRHEYCLRHWQRQRRQQKRRRQCWT